MIRTGWSCRRGGTQSVEVVGGSAMNFRHRSCGEEDKLADCVNCGEVVDHALSKNRATFATPQLASPSFGLSPNGDSPRFGQREDNRPPRRLCRMQ